MTFSLPAVLTAAHCAPFIKVGGKVLVGALSRKDDEPGNAQWRVIKSKAIRHPGYKSIQGHGGEENDSALFRIERVTKPHLLKSIMRLNGNPLLPRNGQVMRSFGHGFTKRAYKSERLKVARLFATPLVVCNKVFLGLLHKRIHICGGTRKQSPQGPCFGSYDDAFFSFVGALSLHPSQSKPSSCSRCKNPPGDSGGPLVVWSRKLKRPIQVGITSFLVHCADPRIPTVFTRVSGNIGWIKATRCKLTSAKGRYCANIKKKRKGTRKRVIV